MHSYISFGAGRETREPFHLFTSRFIAHLWASRQGRDCCCCECRSTPFNCAILTFLYCFRQLQCGSANYASRSLHVSMRFPKCNSINSIFSVRFHPVQPMWVIDVLFLASPHNNAGHLAIPFVISSASAWSLSFRRKRKSRTWFWYK